MTPLEQLFDLTGRTAVVTGGARGVGYAFARGLAAAGANIAFIDVLEQKQDIRAEFPAVKAKHYVCNVVDADALEATFADIVTEFGSIDVVVACAGVNRNLPFLETPVSEQDMLMDVNVKGVYLTAQIGARIMAEQQRKYVAESGGAKRDYSIILVASMASYQCVPTQGSSFYCATKGAVRAMAAPMAKEMAPHGIRVNSISPGYINTEMTRPFPDLMEMWKDEIMLRRVGEPEDLMSPCVFLASEGARFVTASDVVVDGGTTHM